MGVGNRFAYGNFSLGSFVKLLAEALAILPNPPASWSVPAWFIDPGNASGNASDRNAGTTAAAPLLTYKELARRWGTTSPTLRQNTTITWLSSQTDTSDPVEFDPTLIGATAILAGQWSAAQNVGGGVLAGVVAKNRAGGQLLNADLGAVYAPGTFVINTTAGKSSYAVVVALVAGTVHELSQPLTPQTLPVSFVAVPAEVDTWANGDTFTVRAPVVVDIARVAPLTTEYVLPNFDSPVTLLHLKIPSFNGAGNTSALIGNDTSIVECAADALVVEESSNDDEFSFMTNSGFVGGVFGHDNAGLTRSMFGGFVLAPVGSFVSWSIEFDAILDQTVASFVLFNTIASSSGSRPNIGKAFIRGIVEIGGTWSIAGSAFAGSSIVWGPGTFNAIARARLIFNQAVGAVATFLCAALQLNGNGNANAFDYAAGTWSATRALTAANLDAAIGAGGFGGVAINPAGAAITNEASL